MSKFVDDGLESVDAALADLPFSPTPEHAHLRVAVKAILGYLDHTMAEPVPAEEPEALPAPYEPPAPSNDTDLPPDAA